VLSQADGFAAGGVCWWDILFRSQPGPRSVVFFESCTPPILAQLASNPLQPIELILALMSSSLVRGLCSASHRPILCDSVLRLQPVRPWPAAGRDFFFNLLLMGWAIGLLVSALVL